MAGMSAAAWVRGLEPNLVEEGLVLHVAERLLRGEHLYRDVAFFTGPLPFELLAVMFRLFGSEIAVARGFMALLHGAASALAYLFARRSLAGPFAHGAAAVLAASPLLLFPLLTMFYYTPLALHLATFAAFAVLCGIASPAWAAAAGALAAAVALCKQTLGVTIALALLLALVANSAPGTRRARALAFVSGGAAVAAITLLAFALAGSLRALLHWLVVVPLSIESEFNSPFINLWPLGVLAPEIIGNRILYLPSVWFLRSGVLTQVGPGMVLTAQVLYTLPFALPLATALARLAGPLPAGLWINAALLLALAGNLFPRADWGHLVYTLPPAGVQLFLLAGRVPAARGVRRGVAAGVAAASVLALAVSGAGVGLWLNRGAQPPSYGPRVPLRPLSLSTRSGAIPRVISYLRQRVRPGEPIFVARAEPLIYFATETTNPTPYTGVLTAFNEEQQHDILAALPKTRFVVMSDIDQPLMTYYSDVLPDVWDTLERYYRIAPYFPIAFDSWILVLERNGDRGPTAIDLIREPGRAFVRDAPGRESYAVEPPARFPARLNRRTLGIRLGPYGGGRDWEIDVPAHARLQLDVGYSVMVSTHDMHLHPAGTRAVISLKSEGDYEVLHRQPIVLRPQATPEWTPIEVDLSRYAGRHVTLRIEIESDAPVGSADYSWLGSPRIALPPRADAAAKAAPPAPASQ
jgi:hypothetical protein